MEINVVFVASLYRISDWIDVQICRMQLNRVYSICPIYAYLFLHTNLMVVVYLHW